MPSESRPLVDVDAERAVLCAALRQPDMIPDLDATIGSADPWTVTAHRILWRYLSTTRDPIGLVSVAQALATAGTLADVGGAAYLSDLWGYTGATVGAKRSAAYVVDLSRIRRLRDTLAELHGSATEPEQTAAQYGDRILSAVLGLVHDRGDARARVVGDLIAEVLRDIETAQRGGTTDVGLPIPWSGLSDCLLGLERGRLYVVAARPAMGKSVMGLQLAAHAARTGHSALLYSLEMSGYQLATRVLSSESGVGLGAIRTRQIDGARWGDLMDGAGRASEWSLAIDDSAGLTIHDIRSRTRRLVAHGACDLVVVDYLQIMASTARRGASREQDVSEMSRGLKMLARELNIPVVALSQLNRDLEKRTDKRPILADLRESGSIEQDADTVVMLYRPAVYEPEGSAAADDPTIEAIVRKQRDGRLGTVALRFDGARVRITE